MHLYQRKYIKIPFVVFFLFTSLFLFSQAIDTLPKKVLLHVESQIDTVLQKEGKRKYFHTSDTVVATLLRKIENITELLNRAASISQRGFDTVIISNTLPETEQLITILSNDFNANQQHLTLRNLKTTRSLLVQMETSLTKWQNLLFSYCDELAVLNSKMANSVRDSAFRNLPKDSLLRRLYFEQIEGLSERWHIADSLNNKNIFSIGLLQNRVAGTLINANELLIRINYSINKFVKELWEPEEPALWALSSDSYPNSLSSVVQSSWKTFLRLIAYYFNIGTSGTIVIIVILLFLFFWLRYLLRRLKKDELHAQQVLRNIPILNDHLFLAVFAFILGFLPFIYFNLPPSWSTLIWTLLAIIYTVIAFSGFSKPQRIFWSVFLFMFLFNDFTGLLFKSSYGERWLQLIFSIVNVLFGLMVIKHVNLHKKSFPAHVKPVIIIYVLFAAVAIPANITGCVMLCKSLNSGAVYAMLAAQTFYTCSKIFIEIIYLHHEAYKEHRLASYFDFYKMQQSLQQILKIIAVICWLIVMFRNLNFFDFVYDRSVVFLNTPRTLGDNSFTFGSIVVFLLVIWFSSFLSNFITILFSDNSVTEKSRKSRWSSVLILLRLAVLAAGIIIAFAASGIPMDKLTIIIGALGVGIGFGLQNIVNNLVSGVILAFEKPIQTGDAIEIGNRYGIVKEIGIRSSKLLTADGSLIIIPNGDLLSQHIINWTLNTHTRRVELMVGVAYKSNLTKAEEILRGIINVQDDIEKIPLPQILAHQFAESAVEFRILFWCDIDKWIAVKSELVMKIHEAFAANGIEIPFPQRDINIKSQVTAKDLNEKKE